MRFDSWRQEGLFREDGCLSPGSRRRCETGGVVASASIRVRDADESGTCALGKGLYAHNVDHGVLQAVRPRQRVRGRTRDERADHREGPKRVQGPPIKSDWTILATPSCSLDLKAGRKATNGDWPVTSFTVDEPIVTVKIEPGMPGAMPPTQGMMDTAAVLSCRYRRQMPIKGGLKLVGPLWCSGKKRPPIRRARRASHVCRGGRLQSNLGGGDGPSQRRAQRITALRRCGDTPKDVWQQYRPHSTHTHTSTPSPSPRVRADDERWRHGEGRAPSPSS